MFSEQIADSNPYGSTKSISRCKDREKQREKQVFPKKVVSLHAYHDRALVDEFKNRGIDVSAISDGQSINFAHPITYSLIENKLIPIN